MDILCLLFAISELTNRRIRCRRRLYHSYGISPRRSLFCCIECFIRERLDPRHAVYIHAFVCFIHAHKTQTFVGDVFDVIFQLVQVNSTNIAERVVCPVGFQLDSTVDCFIDIVHVLRCVQFREINKQLFEHFSEEVAVLILIALNVRDHLAGCHHLLVTSQIVEEGECTVEENTFKYEVGYHGLEECLWRRLVPEALIDIGDKPVAVEQYGIIFPIFKISFAPAQIRWKTERRSTIGYERLPVVR